MNDDQLFHYFRPGSRQVRDERFEQWIDTINQACGSFHADARSGRFEGGIQPRESGGLRLSVVEAAHTRLYRNDRDVCASDDQKFFAVLQLHGRSGVEQLGNMVALGPGDIVLIDAAYPCSVTFDDHAKQISLILPRTVVERNVRSGSLQCGRRIAAASPIAAMTRGLLQEIANQPGAELSHLEGEATLDALVSLLRTVVDPDQNQDRERMLRQAMDYIDRHLQSEHLTPESVARSIGCSLRGLYRVFSKHGLNVAQYIRNRRLDACAASLRTMPTGPKLSALCYEWGFPNSSHFSRAFKLRFGVSPSQYLQLHAQTRRGAVN